MQPEERRWDKSHSHLYELFGEHPPVAFLARLESERAALQVSPMIHHLEFAGRMMAEAEKRHTHIIPRAWINSFLAAWLLGASYVNPLI